MRLLCLNVIGISMRSEMFCMQFCDVIGAVPGAEQINFDIAPSLKALPSIFSAASLRIFLYVNFVPLIKPFLQFTYVPLSQQLQLFASNGIHGVG